MITTGILMGLAGTAAMDVLALILARAGIAPFPNWAMPGRWLVHALRGKIWHEDIGRSEPVAIELGLGWVFHYAVGIIYGVIFVILAGGEWLANPVFLPLWVFSIITIAAGWFLLQPGMGLGWAASKTPNPWKVRMIGLLSHTAFAIGMWAVVVFA